MSSAQPNRRHLLSALTSFTALGPLGLARRLQQPSELGRASDYDLESGLTYLNHASIGTMPRLVREAFAAHTAQCESNPWLYTWGDAWDAGVARAHAAAAQLLACPQSSIALIRNTTEGFSLLAQGLPLGPQDEVLFSSLNHVGASEGWRFHAKRRGYQVRTFDFPEAQSAELSTQDLVDLHIGAISDATRVLVLPHVDNVFGFRHPIAAIAKAARAKGVRWIAVDAAQSVGMFPFAVADLGADFVATSAHKWIQAPKGTGILYAAEQAIPDLSAMVVTWGQRQWQGTAKAFADYGTRDLAKVLALGDALAFHAKLSGTQAAHQSLRAHIQERVANESSLRFRSPARWEDGAALVAIEVPRAKAGELAKSLFQEHGIVVRGFNGKGRNTLRLSPNLANTREQLDTCLAAILRSLG